MRPHLVWFTLVVSLGMVAGVRAQSPSAADGGVVLPVDEYRALHDRANPPAPAPDTPPVEATLTRVDYELRVDGDAVAGRALLTIDVLSSGWTRVQIPPGLRARDARVDGETVPLLPGPPPYVLLPRSGRFLVALDLAMPIATSGGAESVLLPPAASAIVRTSLTVPRTGVDLVATNGFVADHAEAAGESRWTVYGKPQQPLGISWKRKIDDRRAELPLRLRARVTTLAGLGEETCAITTAVRVEVVQGVAREIAIAVPTGLTINEVSGPTVGEWVVEGGLLRIVPLDSIATEMSFVVQGESRVARDGAITVPLVRVPAAERETGGVAVDVVGAGEVSGRVARGLDPADPSDLDDVVSGRETPSMLAFRSKPVAGNEPRSLAVTVVRYTPQAVLVANVEEARYRVLASEDGRLLIHARYAIRNNQRSFLKVTLPAGASVWSAEVAGRPVRPGLAETGAVLLPLEKGRAGTEAPAFAVDLVYLQRINPWSDKGSARLTLPALDLPTSRTGVVLFHSPRFRVDPRPGAFRAEADPGVFADVLRSAESSMHRDNESGTGLGVGGAATRAATGGLQQLVERFRKDAGGRTTVGTLPIHVDVPAVGPSIFLASELTGEDTAPSIDLTFKRARS